MQQSIKNIGIMGGTFNPIQIGHLIVAEDVREKFRLDKVLFIPSGQPPHKPDSEVIAAEHRYEMVRLAVNSNRYFEASRIEIDREGTTYTINTLQALKEEYDSDTRFFFIVGADVIPELTTWREYQKVFMLCDFIAVFRPGYEKAAFETAAEQLTKEYGIRIQMAEARLVDISSTEIREKCSRGESVKYLISEDVEKYIHVNGLYKKLQNDSARGHSDAIK